MSEPQLHSLVIAPGDAMPEYVVARQSQSAQTGGIEQSRWAVLMVLFIVTGAFGLSLLWRSARFSVREKCFWSLLVIIYTAGLFYLMVMMIRWSIGETH